MKSRNEVDLTFEKYGLFHGEKMTPCGESTEIQRLVWFLNNGKIEPFESPDAYVAVNNQILIIEHFEIDGFETYSNGGSRYKRQAEIAECEFKAINATESGVCMTTTIGISNSYEGLIRKCKTIFDEHYSRISSYKKHLLDYGIANDTTQFTVCFLIDDVSPLGTLTYDGNDIQPVCLGRSKEFLEYYLSKTNVDWIISAVVRMPDIGYYPYFFSRLDIDYCLKHTLDYANYQLLPSNNTAMTRFKAIINYRDIL